MKKVKQVDFLLPAIFLTWSIEFSIIKKIYSYSILNRNEKANHSLPDNKIYHQ